MSLGKKLRQARKLLGDTQTIASHKSGISQSDISYMEVGKRKNIPEEYLFYLYQNGIDLNALCDETKGSITMQKDSFDELQILLTKIRQKDEMIELLKDSVKLRDHQIEKLNFLVAENKIIV